MTGLLWYCCGAECDPLDPSSVDQEDDQGCDYTPYIVMSHTRGVEPRVVCPYIGPLALYTCIVINNTITPPISKPFRSMRPWDTYYILPYADTDDVAMSGYYSDEAVGYLDDASTASHPTKQRQGVTKQQGPSTAGRVLRGAAGAAGGHLVSMRVCTLDLPPCSRYLLCVPPLRPRRDRLLPYTDA